MSLHSGLISTHGLRVLRVICLVGCALVTPNPAYGQSTAEWLTSSVDPARDAWQRGESKITTKNVRKLQLLWKTKVESKTMGMQSFREPLIVSGVKTADGARTVAILAGASNDVFALDAETGKVIWQTKLKWSSEKPQEPGEGAGFICTNALSATPVISPMDASVRRLYVLTSDGYLHIMDLSTGSDSDPPIQVLSMPYGKPYGLNLVKNVLYTITGQGCGGVPNAHYAVNLENRKVAVSTPPQAG
jgi:outer membrane protein assembly factor BamB